MHAKNKIHIIKTLNYVYDCVCRCMYLNGCLGVYMYTSRSKMSVSGRTTPPMLGNRPEGTLSTVQPPQSWSGRGMGHQASRPNGSHPTKNQDKMAGEQIPQGGGMLTRADKQQNPSLDVDPWASENRTMSRTRAQPPSTTGRTGPRSRPGL